MNGKKALLLGASGPAGAQMLKQLLADDAYNQVTVYVRRSFATTHPKLIVKLISLSNLNEAVVADDIFCCLGTSIKKAGSKKAFEEINLCFPLKVASLQKKAGSLKFVVVSALGADAHATDFYHQIKGKLEEELKAIDFPCLFILRPPVISEKRKSKSWMEKISAGLLSIIQPLLIGPFKKFRTVSATVVARAMVHYANSTETGTKIIFPDVIKSFEF